jgi:integrase/recombinase XerD
MVELPRDMAYPHVDASHLDDDIRAFLTDREVRGLADGTLRHYTQKLAPLRDYLRDVGAHSLRDVTPQHLREYLQRLARTHNPGGVHAFYRTARALLRWYEEEEEPEGWNNPIHKVRAPKVPQQVLEPAPLDEVQRMLAQCTGTGRTARRDKALILTLLDTGCRASELLSLTIGDVDLPAGTILVRQGKGGKVRSVFLGKRTKRALGVYLRTREGLADHDPLFATIHGTPLRYEGLRDIIRRRADRAGVPPPTLHSFRRAFALNCLRNGMDVYSLQRLMGHADLTILRRYLAQTTDDLQRAHRLNSPVDRLMQNA